jgi:hypothetical protein
MTLLSVQCNCGAVEIRVATRPMAQYFCHCDDCQAVHGGPYAVSLYKSENVSVARGDTVAFVLRTTPRTQCASCAMFLFAEVPGYGVRGLNAELLPKEQFNPQFHLQCQFSARRIADALPHFKALPAEFGGSGELMTW